MVVDRPAAAFAAWYELFPRSQGRVPGRHGTFDDCDRAASRDPPHGLRRRLPAAHPPDRPHRAQGPGQRADRGPRRPGQPVGHRRAPRAATPRCTRSSGRSRTSARLVKAAQDLGIEIALDFAIQCSPDHPWVREHPEWFYPRPDGTIKYAENPPKKYQDIYPLNFASPAWESLWDALLGVVLLLDRPGRADLPGGQSAHQAARLLGLADPRGPGRAHPDVIFLSEAFTRPKVMRRSPRPASRQSYTYFTWRNFKEELTEYFEELTPLRDGRVLPRQPLRQHARHPPRDPAARRAARLPDARRPGRHALVALRHLQRLRALRGARRCPAPRSTGTRRSTRSACATGSAPGNISDYIARLNAIRRENPALHAMAGLRFYPADSPHVLFYGKHTPARDNVILVAVNLDPFATHEATLQIPLAEIGIAADETYELHELLTATAALVRGAAHSVALDPRVAPAHIYRVGRWRRRERDFDYYRREPRVDHDDDPALVQGRGLLRAARARVQGRQRRRHRRLLGPDQPARLPQGARRRLPLAPAVLPVAAARRRLRRRRLPARSTPTTAPWPTSSASSRRPTATACASSPISW